MDGVHRLKRLLRGPLVVATLVGLVLSTVSCSSDEGPITISSGRGAKILEPVIERFTAETGIAVEVRYGHSRDLAVEIIDGVDDLPSIDVFFGQEPASLGELCAAGMLRRLPNDLVASVVPGMADPQGRWVGTSGRARIVGYDTTRLDPSDLPVSAADLVDPEWAGRVAFAPANGAFIDFVAAMILHDGEETTREWLEAMAARSPHLYASNDLVVVSIAKGEADLALTNHNYVRHPGEGEDRSKLASHFLSGGVGTFLMTSGIGVLESSDHAGAAERFVEFVLSPEIQAYFAEQLVEYPLVRGAAPPSGLPALDTLDTPDIDLSAIASVVDRATELISEAGLSAPETESDPHEQASEHADQP